MIEKIRQSKPKILVIGDLMIDKYLWGRCERISPEAPVQIIDIYDEELILGGAGNVVQNLKALGSEVSIISAIGNCKHSNDLKKLLNRINVDTNFLVYEEGRITPKKTRIISSHQQVVRYDIETKNDISPEIEDEIINIFMKNVMSFDLVILSDYAKGLLTESLCQKIIKISNKNSKKVIVDPKGTDFNKYSSAYLLTPNRSEASRALNENISDRASIDSALRKLKEKFNLSVSLITLSEDGIATLETTTKIHPTKAKEVFDVTGAGDTVIASLGYALAANLNIENAVYLANLAAGVVVSKLGSATASFEEIMLYEKNIDGTDFEDALKSWDEIKLLSDKYKSLNKKIVFTNGCFDILHIGHISYLHKAKKLGDILIVGINSDSSVKLLKGSSRPINSLNDRMKIISSLKPVDYVVSFNDETPDKLIEMIEPDILTKGSDYANKEIAGSGHAKELILIDFVNGKSTSNLIESIKNERSN